MPKREPVQNPLNGRPLLQPTTRPNFYTRGGGAQLPARDNSYLQLAEALSAISPVLQRYQQKKQGESFVEGQASIDLANLTGELETQRNGFKQAVKSGEINEKADIYYWRGRAQALGAATASHTLRERLNEALREGELNDFDNPNQVMEVVGRINNETLAELGNDPFALEAYNRASVSEVKEFVRKADYERNKLFKADTEAKHTQAGLANLEAIQESPEQAEFIVKRTLQDLRNANIANPSQFFIEGSLKSYVQELINDGQASEALNLLDDLEDIEVIPGSSIGNVQGYQSLITYATQQASAQANAQERQNQELMATGRTKAQEDWSQTNRDEETARILVDTFYDTDASFQEKVAYEEEINKRLRLTLSEPDSDNYDLIAQRLQSYDITGAEELRETLDLSEEQEARLDVLKANIENAVGIVDQGKLLTDFQKKVYGYEDSTYGDVPPILDAEATQIFFAMPEGQRTQAFQNLFGEWVNQHRERIVNGGYETLEIAKQEYPAVLNELNSQFPQWINEKIKAQAPKIKKSQIRQGIQKTVSKLQETISIQNDYSKQLAQPQYGELPNEPEELIALIDQGPNYPTSQVGSAEAKPNNTFRRFFFGDRDAADQKYYNIVQDVDVRILKDGETRLATKAEKIQAFVEEGVTELNKRVRQSGGSFDGNLKGDINLFVERVIDLGKADVIPDSTLTNWGIDPEAFREAKPGQLSNKQALQQRREALEKYYLLKLQNGLTPDEFLSGKSEDDIPLPQMIDYRSVRLFSNLAELEEAWNGGNIEPGSLFWQIGQKVGQNYDLEPINLYLAQRFLFTQ